MTALIASAVGAFAAILGVALGRLWDQRSESYRWLRNARMECLLEALVCIDNMRDYAKRLTQSNTRRSVDEKVNDKHRYGEEQRKVLQACSRLKLLGDPPLRDAGAELATYIKETLTPWTNDALRSAEANNPYDAGDVTLVNLEGHVRAFEHEARGSLTGARLQRNWD